MTIKSAQLFIFLFALITLYAKFHNNDQISHDVFRNIGKHHRHNYVLFSTFDYSFQGRSYFYFGVANMVFFAGSTYDRRASKVYKVI